MERYRPTYAGVLQAVEAIMKRLDSIEGLTVPIKPPVQLANIAKILPFKRRA